MADQLAGRIGVSVSDSVLYHDRTGERVVGNEKTRYEIDLSTVQRRAACNAISVRPLAPSDRDALAQLMLDAYVGTID